MRRWLRPIYRDRADAGAKLAEQLGELRSERTLVLGIPTGGLAVGAALARAFGAPLDVIAVCPLEDAQEPCRILGAVTASGARHVDERAVRELGVGDDYLEAEARRQALAAEAQERALRHDRPASPVHGRDVIIVDDGLSSCATLCAAARDARAAGARRVVAAVPVCAPITCKHLLAIVDRLVCGARPRPYLAANGHYEDFSPVSEEEARAILAAAAGSTAVGT